MFIPSVKYIEHFVSAWKGESPMLFMTNMYNNRKRSKSINLQKYRFMGPQYILDRQKKKEGFAQIGYCAFARTNNDRKGSVDAHPIKHVRVNAAIATLPAFYTSFDVNADDGMYVAPADRVSLW